MELGSPIYKFLSLSWVRNIPEFIANHAVEFLLLFTSILVLTVFRHQIFYSEFHYDSKRPESWDENVSLSDYVDDLLAQPRTRKLKISQDMVNDIYLTVIDEETINVKKMKETTLLFRIFLQVISRGPLWFIRHCVFERNITLAPIKTEETEKAKDEGCILFDQNHVQVLVQTKESEFKDLNEKLMDAVLKNIPDCNLKSSGLSNSERKAVFKKILKPLVHFVRGAGYLYFRKLVTQEVDWGDEIFFNTVIAIGAALDPVLFRIRVRLAQTSTNFTMPIPKPDLVIFEYRSNAFIKAEQTAKIRLNEAKERLKEATNKVQDQLAGSSKDKSDLFLKEQALIDSFAEENAAEAVSPEVYARDSDIAQIFLKGLKTLSRISIQEALRHPLVNSCNKFVKTSSNKSLQKFHQPLQSFVTATKLGLTPTQLQKNAGFEDFAKKTHLHRYLFIQKHELEVDSLNRILIMFQGEVLPWEQVLPKLLFEKKGNTFLGQYSRLGLVNYGVYDWDILQPFYIEKNLPPPWGDRYLCEVCSWIIDKPRVRGDHTFLRLKTPKGEWYSVGQYVLAEMVQDQFLFPMALRPSRFMSPDVSEYWNGNFTTLAFEITFDQFGLMKEKIENDKKKQFHLYQLYQNNCTIWAQSIVELAGLSLPSSLDTADLFAPNLTAFGRKVNGMWFTPKWLRSLVKTSWAVFLNSLSLVLGSWRVHPEVRNDPNFSTAVPYIHSISDIFDTNKVVSQHPFVIGTHIRHQVEEWRYSQKEELLRTKDEILHKTNSAAPEDKQSLKEKLDVIEKSLESIQYAIPDKFRIPQSSNSEDASVSSDN